MHARSPVFTLLLLALLAQASVPILHAQNWARMQGDSSLAYAFCGKLSPVLAAKLRTVAPPELIRELAPKQNVQECKLCFVVGALGALLGATGIVLWLFARKPIRLARHHKERIVLRRTRFFHARAPPVPTFA